MFDKSESRIMIIGCTVLSMQLSHKIELQHCSHHNDLYLFKIEIYIITLF